MPYEGCPKRPVELSVRASYNDDWYVGVTLKMPWCVGWGVGGPIRIWMKYGRLDILRVIEIEWGRIPEYDD